jgi:hypothetical protein
MAGEHAATPRIDLALERDLAASSLEAEVHAPDAREQRADSELSVGHPSGPYGRRPTDQPYGPLVASDSLSSPPVTRPSSVSGAKPVRA